MPRPRIETPDELLDALLKEQYGVSARLHCFGDHDSHPAVCVHRDVGCHVDITAIDVAPEVAQWGIASRFLINAPVWGRRSASVWRLTEEGEAEARQARVRLRSRPKPLPPVYIVDRDPGDEDDHGKSKMISCVDVP